MMQVNVGGKLFTSTKKTLSKCEYFAGLLLAPPAEEIPFVDRPSTGFKHVLYYLQDDGYPFPLQFSLELDFYGVPYPKYSLMRKNDLVNVFIAGAKFTVKAARLMENSPYLEKKLSPLYVGTDLHLKGSAKGFAHLLRRIDDRGCYIPYKYKEQFEKYQGPPIEWHPDTLVTHIVDGVKVYNNYSLLAKIPYLTDFLAKGFVPGLTIPIKAWRNIVRHIFKNGPALLSYYEWYTVLKVVPTDWYRVSYSKCPTAGCTEILKTIVNDRYIDKFSAPQYCVFHGCVKCTQKATKNNLCANHQ